MSEKQQILELLIEKSSRFFNAQDGLEVCP
jgi:hypothetical protein